jgi:hypothetical protein
MAASYRVDRTLSAYPPGSLDRIEPAWHPPKVDLCRIPVVIPEPEWVIWLPCSSGDDDIMPPESSFVKRRSQPLEEHRLKNLLEQARAYPACPERSRGELGEEMRSASPPPIAQSKPTPAGSGATYPPTTCVTRPKRCPELSEGWAAPPRWPLHRLPSTAPEAGKHPIGRTPAKILSRKTGATPQGLPLPRSTPTRVRKTGACTLATPLPRSTPTPVGKTPCSRWITIQRSIHFQKLAAWAQERERGLNDLAEAWLLVEPAVC